MVNILSFPSDQLKSRAAEYCADSLIAAMATHSHVLLLISGGSAVSMYRQMFNYIGENVDLSALQVGIVDERFGPYGHADSNEQQLFLASVIAEFESRGATFTGMLQPDVDTRDQNQKLKEVALIASQKYRDLFDQANYVLVFSGMGDDGHTAGWLPTQTREKFSELYTGEPGEYVVGYAVDSQDSSNPHHLRLTISLRTIKSIDKVVIFTAGEKKRTALIKYSQQNQEPNQLPIMILNDFKPVFLTDIQL